MAQISVYNTQGKEVEKLDVSDSVFAVPANDTLVHQVFVAIMANIRGVYAHTKTRGEVSGSGKKPWKQKGTGRARVGSVRNPVWRSGGTVFGPRNVRNFAQKVNQKMRRKAFLTALSGKIRDEKVRVIDDFAFEAKKTKYMAQTLRDLHLDGKSVVFGWGNSEREMEKTSRNLPRTINVLAENLNVADLLNHQYLVLTKETLEAMESRLLKTDRKNSESTK